MIYTPDSPWLGTTPPNAAARCAMYLLSRPHGEYSAHDIGNVIVPAYAQLCARTDLNLVLVIAQLIHETGNLTSWWAARPRRNPAGIGVTGRTSASKPAMGSWALHDGVWKEGVSFASWKDSAGAHVGRLLAYALHDDHATPAQRALIGGALAIRPLPAAFRGVAPTIEGLQGRWAVPGTDLCEQDRGAGKRDYGVTLPALP